MNDLISRAAALNAIDCWHIDFNSMDGAKVQTDCWRTIKELPAMDAVPVVHARWKSVKAGASNNYPFWDSRCSECGYTTAMTQTGWLYCPHCGAKMDGDANG